MYKCVLKLNLKFIVESYKTSYLKEVFFFNLNWVNYDQLKSIKNSSFYTLFIHTNYVIIKRDICHVQY